MTTGDPAGRSEEEKRRAVREAFRRREALAKTGIQGAMQRFSLESYVPVGDKAGELFRQVRQYAEEGFKRRGDNWLLFAGRTGTGKTHLAVAIAGHVAACQENWACYTSLARMMRRIRCSFRRQEGESEDELVDYYQLIGLLVIDEFGLRSGLSDWERATLDDILDHRWARQFPTVLVTNLTPNEFFAMAGDRVESRFADCGRILTFTWEDYRKRPRPREDDNPERKEAQDGGEN